jgi:hypothetical protein
MLVGLLVFGVVTMSVGGMLGNQIAALQTPNPTWNMTEVAATDPIMPTMDLFTTISKVIVAGAGIGLVIVLVYGIMIDPSRPSGMGTRPREEPRVIRTAAEAVAEQNPYQPAAEQPASEKQEGKKKPEKRDRYEVVKV